MVSSGSGLEVTVFSLSLGWSIGFWEARRDSATFSYGEGRHFLLPSRWSSLTCRSVRMPEKGVTPMPAPTMIV